MPYEKGLRCGQYSCPSLCHSGHCPPYLETIFTDLTCACKRNSIPPPHLCSTLPYSCQRLVDRCAMLLRGSADMHVQLFVILFFHILIVGFNIDTSFKASIIQKLLVRVQPVETNRKKIPLDQRRLMCDDEFAFCVTIPNLDTFYFGKNFAISKVLVDLFRSDPKWVLFVKERCKFLVLGKGKAILFAFMYFVHFFIPKNILHPPIFDPLIDMDPRLLVALFDLPRDANISALVLRFGSECELVWLHDKNALVVFSDLALATPLGANTSGSTRLAKDGGASGSLKRNPWKKVVMQKPNLAESSWGGEVWSHDSVKTESLA
ncbi:NF-X1-type zinc finger protein NFXL1 [Camellia lanceoleosa]|uniref:NF-X1-type zinc finger protein NFXL1 n=1 Tax=Camellia lanceoleosa TaxID=1840588 RepID=A0ACC0I1G2_9ERIC|nr:NF-X1-type zinc finger protein NFXL1 [Camellia lanceoleosa]